MYAMQALECCLVQKLVHFFVGNTYTYIYIYIIYMQASVDNVAQICCKGAFCCFTKTEKISAE